MDFNNFQEQLITELKRLSYIQTDAQIELKQIQKLNRSYTGLIVHNDKNTLPVINLNQLFDMYQNAFSWQEIVTSVETILQTDENIVDTEMLKNYEMCKQYLTVRLSNYDKNKDILSNLPYRQVENLVLTLHLQKRTADDTTMGVLVNDVFMKYWNVDEDTLFKQAFQNGLENNPPILKDMETFLYEMTGVNLPVNNTGMYVLTNQEMMYGAASIFYPGVFRNIETLFQGDFICIPSSVHEWIVLKDDEIDYERLGNIIFNINEDQVKEDERLSNDVYRYNCIDHTFVIVHTCE